MPIDIQAFRSITGRSDQESLFYVKDNNLMATTARDVRSTGSVHHSSIFPTSSSMKTWVPAKA